MRRPARVCWFAWAARTQYYKLGGLKKNDINKTEMY